MVAAAVEQEVEQREPDVAEQPVLALRLRCLQRVHRNRLRAQRVQEGNAAELVVAAGEEAVAAVEDVEQQQIRRRRIPAISLDIRRTISSSTAQVMEHPSLGRPGLS